MKVKMIKGVFADGSFWNVGEIIDVEQEQANELIRTKVAEESKDPEKKTSGRPKKDNGT